MRRREETCSIKYRKCLAHTCERPVHRLHTSLESTRVHIHDIRLQMRSRRDAWWILSHECVCPSCSECAPSRPIFTHAYMFCLHYSHVYTQIAGGGLGLSFIFLSTVSISMQFDRDLIRQAALLRLLLEGEMRRRGRGRRGVRGCTKVLWRGMRESHLCRAVAQCEFRLALLRGLTEIRVTAHLLYSSVVHDCCAVLPLRAFRCPFHRAG